MESEGACDVTPLPSSPAGDQSAAGQPVGGQPVGGEPGSGQPVGSQPGSGQSGSGQSGGGLSALGASLAAGLGCAASLQQDALLHDLLAQVVMGQALPVGDIDQVGNRQLLKGPS